ncbi:T9SS type B sorting domain-containing protein [Mariniflexile gromovii]|uniref:T9SS type B sorting domain-containing protein n=1 Tax=Mariniflexile gromovii TaxID=362523 RepID=A0ABS4BV78_9FLAO|nr:T9SS type B sorting domain-containing protein [Mariniflexile gromovii]MBP0903911.1 T9SS type B sorting domain-containing protein [Mariniflexile gromovii]
MRIQKHIDQLLFILIICVGQFAFSQLSKTHYIPPLTESGTNSSQPQDHYIYISTPSTNLVSFSIQLLGSGATITGTVSKASPYIYNIGTGRDTQLFVNVNETSRVKTNKGFIVEAESPVYVSVRINAGAQAGALVSKGASALGNTFRVGSFTNSNPQTNYLNFVSVMATSDNTLVVFSDLPAGLIIENYVGVTPISVTLNKGESYVVATNSANSIINRDGLIGCLVQSNKPIVVNCGSANGSFYGGSGRDYGIDQIVDASKIGKEYIFVRGAGDDGWENILLVAHSNNTFISINGNSPVGPISEGEYYLIEGSSYNANGNMYVETTEDVFAYQGIGGLAGAEANQGMFFVPPLSCETRGNLDNIAAINNIGSTVYTGGITIVTKATATITINNTPISSFNAVGPSTVTGKPDYVTYKVLNLSGNISVQSNDELYCAYFNQNNNATSGSFYSGFPTAPEINFNAQFTTLGNCIPNITLEAANTQSFDSFEWWFDDGSGSGFQNTLISTPNLTPTVPGKYKLIGIVTCSGLTLESIEVPVSICPDDIDNDGIIDNLDIDNDNDGILNCTESRGNVEVNLSIVTTPELVFEDGSRNYGIATGIHTASNTSGTPNYFTGNSSGGFSSNLSPGSSSENNYQISFTEPVNIKYQESITHTNVDGEYFIVGILPLNKNITLVDPDNRLLVDSNFDGIFETGITTISGSEIHFKINPSPSGNTPYTFLANQVDGFSFVHKLENATTGSIFTGGLSLTCFKKDSDLDGIEDALDLDSDNDGIPDFIENTGTIIALSGIDTDKNGLDDVYNINATPLDSDADGVYDFYDLDSDNDGIYDLEESGSNLPDTNFDGIIDNINTKIGTNGWDDNAETAPDSNAIVYIVNDVDADSIFSYIDLDSDGDLCSDVIEAGFSDANNDNLLGNTTVTTNTSGKVTNATDGYTQPNSNYLNFAPLSITTQPVDTEVCERLNTTISIVSAEAESYQWETSTDGINWNPITDNAIYSGSQTANLDISNTPLSYNNYQYRVKLDRVGNSCGLYSNSITLSVIPSPIVNPSVSLIQCDDDIDGISFFNLTEANHKISTNVSNETFLYFKTQIAANSGDTTSTDYITSPTTYQNSASPFTEVVWARTTSASGCAAISQIQLQVSISQIPSGAINEIIDVCDDFLDINGNNNNNNDDTDGIASFNFSYVKAMVESFFLPQTPSVTFYRNEADALAENNAITDTSNYRNIGYPHSQQIYIRVDSEISNDCQALGPYITLNVNPLPEFTVETPQIVCTSDPSFSIILDPFEANVTENFNYSWFFEGNEIATSSTLEVSTPGIYTVTLTKTDGSSCSRSKAISVEASETANITQNDVTINDLAENNSVIINPDNLGSGNYEYALREVGAPFINYQAEPVFNNVKPGFYTIYVQDEICGESTLDISVIGYTKYFTPNGDGFNDFWQIKGINTDIQPNSIIFIYDRYGKLLKQLSPNSVGWDGTFNGNVLPTDDYWFKVFLQDGRNFMGHFTLKR